VDSGFYAACSGLIARTQTLELAANNLANTNTTGYRSQQPTFQTLLAQSTLTGLNRYGTAVNDYGVVGGSRLDQTQGSLQSTGSSLDVGVEGPGYLTVQTPDGVRYTRNGNLKLSKDRQLLTNAGDPVLNMQGQAIRVPEGEVSISGDGTISVGGALAGRIRVVEFSNDTPMTQVGNGYYNAPSAAATPAKSSNLRQGMLESSNVNPVAAAVGLISLQRNAEMLTRAMSTFHNDLNRMAVEDLPKV
jgi:flagellar basal-body rod protein FlgF/flagellar basal-body rod protein FlgG